MLFTAIKRFMMCRLLLCWLSAIGCMNRVCIQCVLILFTVCQTYQSKNIKNCYKQHTCWFHESIYAHYLPFLPSFVLFSSLLLLCFVAHKYIRLNLFYLCIEFSVKYLTTRYKSYNLRSVTEFVILFSLFLCINIVVLSCVDTSSLSK